MSATPITDRVQRIRETGDSALIAAMPSGYAILNDHQPEAITGCCVLLPKRVVPSINDLNQSERDAFMRDFLRLGDAILRVTGAQRVNYLILCNQAPELHAHAIPRFAGESAALRRLGPFEAYDFGASPRCDPAGAHRDLLASLREVLSDA